jgi:hypothetical protein
MGSIMRKRDSERELKVLEDDMQWNENRKDEIRFRLLSNLDDNGSLLVRRKRSRKRRLYVSIPALIAALCLLIVGTGYISPALADKIFRVPVIGELVRENSIVSIIQEGMSKADYNYDGIHISYPDKSIGITLNNEETESKQQIKNYIQETLHKENVQGFDVHIEQAVKQEQEDIVDNVDEQQMGAEELFTEELSDILNKNDLSDLILKSGTNHTKEGSLDIKYQVNNIAAKEDINKIKDFTTQAGKSTGVEIGKIEINRETKKEDQDMRWTVITSLLGDMLMSNPSYHVEGIAYSVYPSIELTIKTNIESTKDKKTQLYTADLEKKIRQVIEDSEEAVQEDYQVIIEDKNHHRIN